MSSLSTPGQRTTAAAAAKENAADDEEIPEDLRCSICLDVLFDPVSLPCGHTFCQPCVHRPHNSKWHLIDTCPLCRQEVSLVGPVNVNVILRDLVKSRFPKQYGARQAAAGGAARVQYQGRRIPIHGVDPSDGQGENGNGAQTPFTATGAVTRAQVVAAARRRARVVGSVSAACVRLLDSCSGVGADGRRRHSRSGSRCGTVVIFVLFMLALIGLSSLTRQARAPPEQRLVELSTYRRGRDARGYAAPAGPFARRLLTPGHDMADWDR
eukprot:TRINITY_DN19381_c0_g1_i1.p1 TRINITY_DN19381_c0_g1~~TRINITY_DN19381_c0_g1_i1.p1  ORF type:complete len:268 (-),score=10.63 TRINITY_DN19381_c0_g1_i1:251-1054(-)